MENIENQISEKMIDNSEMNEFKTTQESVAVENIMTEIDMIETELNKLDSVIEDNYIVNDTYLSFTDQPKFHPCRDGEPLMDKKSLNALKLSILEHGQEEDVEIYEGLIFHGRNRAQSCFELGIPCRVTPYKGKCEDISNYLSIKNQHRNHLTKSDLACIGAEMVDSVKEDSKAKLRQKISEIRTGKLPTLTESIHTYKYVADLVGNIGTTTLKGYYELLKKNPELFAQVKAHTLTFADAQREVLPKVSKPKKERFEFDDETHHLILNISEDEGITPSQLIKKLIEKYYNQAAIKKLKEKK
jgi:hypothetical protein